VTSIGTENRNKDNGSVLAMYIHEDTGLVVPITSPKRIIYGQVLAN